MAKPEAPKTSRLVFTAGNGDTVNVNVAEEVAEQLLGTGSGSFSKPTTGSSRKS